MKRVISPTSGEYLGSYRTFLDEKGKPDIEVKWARPRGRPRLPPGYEDPEETSERMREVDDDDDEKVSVSNFLKTREPLRTSIYGVSSISFSSLPFDEDEVLKFLPIFETYANSHQNRVLDAAGVAEEVEPWRIRCRTAFDYLDPSIPKISASDFKGVDVLIVYGEIDLRTFKRGNTRKYLRKHDPKLKHQHRHAITFAFFPRFKVFRIADNSGWIDSPLNVYYAFAKNPNLREMWIRVGTWRYEAFPFNNNPYPDACTEMALFNLIWIGLNPQLSLFGDPPDLLLGDAYGFKEWILECIKKGEIVNLPWDTKPASSWGFIIGAGR